MSVLRPDDTAADGERSIVLPEPRRPLVPAARTLGTPNGREHVFAGDEIIISKTDRTGKITYANDVFCRFAGYSRADLIGAPHSVIRHPAMPRAVFALLWAEIAAGRELFAYVVNLSRTLEHYWVFAHVTPTFGPDGQITGYHSARRPVERRVIPLVSALYADMTAREAQFPLDKRAAIAASTALLTERLTALGMSYDEYVWSL